MEPQAPPPASPPSRWGAGRIILLVLGSLAALFAIGLLAAGGVLLWANTQKHDDGYFRTGDHNFATSAFALASDDLDVGQDGPDWLFEQGRLARIQIAGSSAADKPLFIGIGPKSQVERYLDGVAHSVVRDVDFDPFRVRYRPEPGDAPSSPPEEQTFWAASDSGPNPEITWDVAKGSWVAVVMNVDASQSVSADLAFGAKVGWIVWVAVGLLVGGALVLAAGGLMLFFGARGGPATELGGPPAVVAPGEVAIPVADYPVVVEGEIDPQLSRALWLVKWLLAIPHYIVLFFLWLAFGILTIVAFFAILFTGRYPRSLFDFNLGVMRWTWRVGFYSYSALATDRYPPFSLGPEPDYPARLDVPYPGELSRGLVLVKWWLLAIPHYLVLAFFIGGGIGWGWVRWGGLEAVLVLFAAIYLLAMGRYHRDIFELLLGINRWVFRVLAYVALMRDEYPPFRLR